MARPRTNLLTYLLPAVAVEGAGVAADDVEAVAGGEPWQPRVAK